jgi:excisionase family DNA binding protein
MITVCTHCQKRFKVNDKFEGRQAPCPNCKKEFILTDSAKTAPVPPPKTPPPAIHLDISKEFYTVKELAGLLNVHPMTVYRMVQRGKITCHQIGRAKRFHRNDVELFLDGCVVS